MEVAGPGQEEIIHKKSEKRGKRQKEGLISWETLILLGYGNKRQESSCRTKEGRERKKTW